MEYKAHIVLVDDEQSATDMYTILLRKNNYFVSPFLSASEALTFLHFTRKKVDLIIADLNMPHMDGFVFLKTLRQQKKYLTTPFIFLTAINEKKHTQQAYQLGAVDFLLKPLDNDLFLAKIEALLHTIRLNQLNASIVLKGDQSVFTLEELIQYCEQEKIDGYVLISNFKKNALITFQKGVLKDIQLGEITGSTAFETMASWPTYRFIIAKGEYSPLMNKFFP